MVVSATRRPALGQAGCVLTEPDGPPLATGLLHEAYEWAGDRWAVVRFDRPGRLISRCLLGGLRHVCCTIGDGPPREAEVDRLAFDPHLGRICVLRLGRPAGAVDGADAP